MGKLQRQQGPREERWEARGAGLRCECRCGLREARLVCDVRLGFRGLRSIGIRVLPVTADVLHVEARHLWLVQAAAATPGRWAARALADGWRLAGGCCLFCDYGHAHGLATATVLDLQTSPVRNPTRARSSEANWIITSAWCTVPSATSAAAVPCEYAREGRVKERGRRGSTRVRVRVHMRVRVCARVCAHACAHACAHVCAQVHVCTSMCACACACAHVCVCMFACSRARVCACVRVLMCACSRVRMWACAHVHALQSVSQLATHRGASEAPLAWLVEDVVGGRIPTSPRLFLLRKATKWGCMRGCGCRYAGD